VLTVGKNRRLTNSDSVAKRVGEITRGRKV
jgi:hypothetical protein